ncbi:hypothetical protein [Microbacterium sp. T32]|uniref:hypothetical protein n=1 Tax=Microbacterium sp. T32 TaxID=1776083 RepID=UPI0007AB6FBE|nr:hypothetical protein [Microbacterium sp. T32]KZE39625.1 hypothetical protein AVW09_04790 [Microbacterium sp. T32]
MTNVPVSQTLLEYRGERYPLHSGGDGYVRLQTDGAPSHQNFPDAIEFNDDPHDPWVKLPRTALSARYAQKVTARWHGVPVIVGERVRRGLSRGMVMIRHEGVEPATAIAAGLRGNRNDGWSALVSPYELERVRVKTTRLPLVRE